MPSPFSRAEGTTLVAVERANGGELAPLEQVLWTLYGFTPREARPTSAGFAFSAGLLIEAGFVEYVDHQLGLTPAGRKLLRRSGLPESARHVENVTQVLEGLDDLDLGKRPQEGGSSAAPSEAEVRQALSDGEQIEETPGGLGTPVVGSWVSTYAGGLYAGSHWAPAVPPAEPDEPDEPGRLTQPSRGAGGGSPAHPFLDRLFGRSREPG